jgi:hypothetical protein
MADPSDLEALAKRFLDLWERQAAAITTDPELGAAMTQMMNLAGLPVSPGATEKVDEDGPSPSRTGASGTPAAPAASRGRHDDLAELARRVAACEERIVALEARASKGRANSGKGSRRRRT